MSSRPIIKLAKTGLNLPNNVPKSPVVKRRTITTTASGGVLEEPKKVPLGILNVGLTVLTGLVIGAAISKNMASFLEENELFVPADDDDDD